MVEKTDGPLAFESLIIALRANPELLFVLRGIDQMDLISEAGNGGTIGDAATPANVLKEESLFGVFGIEMDGNGNATPDANRQVRAHRAETKSSPKARPTHGSAAAQTVVPRRRQTEATVSRSALAARPAAFGHSELAEVGGFAAHPLTRDLLKDARN